MKNMTIMVSQILMFIIIGSASANTFNGIEDEMMNEMVNTGLQFEQWYERQNQQNLVAFLPDGRSSRFNKHVANSDEKPQKAQLNWNKSALVGDDGNVYTSSQRHLDGMKPRANESNFLFEDSRPHLGFERFERSPYESSHWAFHLSKTNRHNNEWIDRERFDDDRFDDDRFNDHNTSPVPLPGAVWLLGSGFTVLLTFKRRKS